jgi:DNA helicase-2/ATP-dependent DNA helicase PcrA
VTLDLSHLNPEQYEAVTHLDGPLLVLAGAGSGKTRVITYRAAWLVDQGIPANNILAVSFTNKAANEMSDRVAELLDYETAGKVHLSTFHALGAQILREDIDKLGFRKPFSIVDESERRRLLRTVLKELRLDGTGSSASRLLNLISRAKNAMSEPMDLPSARYNPEVPRAQRVYDHYNTALRNLNAVDFDDLLLLPTHMLRMFPEVRVKYQRRYRYIMVDEYQDTNPLQLHMLGELVKPEKPNLVAVGDDDQSIYGFRGAAADTILKFDQNFPGAKVVALEQNYRSVSTILEAANALIAHNRSRRKKELWSDLGTGTRIRSYSLETPNAEAQFAAKQIGRIAGQTGMKWGDFAILYRANPQAGAFEEALRQQDIPYKVLGGQSLFDNKEVKDALAYMQLLLNPRDELALRRVINFPTRGIGTTTVSKLADKARETQTPLYDVAKRALTEGELHTRAQRGMKEFLDTIERTRELLYESESRDLHAIITEFLDEVRLEAGVYAAENNDRSARARWRVVTRLLRGLTDLEPSKAFEGLDRWMTGISLDTHNSKDEDIEDEQTVKLLTIHASKGLEFPVVFLSGMAEEFLPHHRALDEVGGVEEERRLCYVGMTRAQRLLFLTRSRAILMRDERKPLKPSRFLEELPEDLVDERHFRRQVKKKNVKKDARETLASMKKMREQLEGKLNSD